MNYFNNIRLGLKQSIISFRYTLKSAHRIVLFGWVYLFSFTLQAQNEVAPPKYFIDDNEVIFEFDIRAYEEGIKDKSSIFQDFKEVDLPKLVTTGVLENWSYQGWTFHRVGENVYRFIKKLDQFSDDFSARMKYLIDGRYWTAPYSQPSKAIDYSSVEAEQVDKDGNAVFTLVGFKDARQVVLSGSFNQWNEQDLRMHGTTEGWQIMLKLPPGIFEYKFIVDGEWMTDPANPNSVPNNYRTLNSILLVGKKVDFVLPGHADAKKVVLSGSFNNWDRQAITCERYLNSWMCSVELPPGKHFYKFIVDGNWILDPNNDLTQKDGRGNLNSVALVK